MSTFEEMGLKRKTARFRTDLKEEIERIRTFEMTLENKRREYGKYADKFIRQDPGQRFAKPEEWRALDRLRITMKHARHLRRSLEKFNKLCSR